MDQKYVVAVAGNMGVGKSSLTTLLVDALQWTPFFEGVDDNPYLADFYRDMRQWSFHSQISFLSRRLHAHLDMVRYPGPVVQDRSIYEDAEIFARNLRQRNNMSRRDYQTYRSLYDGFIQFLPVPDLIIYLKASVPTLIERVHRRGRVYEQDISPLYLQQLNELYNAWIEDFTLCPIMVVETDAMDFVRHQQDFETIKQNMLNKLATEPRASRTPLAVD